MPEPCQEEASFQRPLKGRAQRYMKNSRAVTYGDLKKVVGVLGIVVTVAGGLITYGMTKQASAERITKIEKSVSDLEHSFDDFKQDAARRWEKNDEFAARMERSLGVVEGYLKRLGDK